MKQLISAPTRNSVCLIWVMIEWMDSLGIARPNLSLEMNNVIGKESLENQKKKRVYIG